METDGEMYETNADLTAECVECSRTYVVTVTLVKDASSDVER